MPIQPPRSGISLLSPASLMRNRQSRGNNFQSIMNQFINYGFNKALQDRSYDLAMERDRLNRENRLVDLYAGEVADGSLYTEATARELVEDVLLPGEATDFNLPIIQGPGAEGQDAPNYVPSSALNTRLQAIIANRPVAGTVGLDDEPLTARELAVRKEAGLPTEPITLARNDNLQQVEDIVNLYRTRFGGQPETVALEANFNRLVAQSQAEQPITMDELSPFLAQGESDVIDRITKRISDRADVAYERETELNDEVEDLMRLSQIRKDGIDQPIGPDLAQALVLYDRGGPAAFEGNEEARTLVEEIIPYVQPKPDPIAMETELLAAANELGSNVDAVDNMAAQISNLIKTVKEDAENPQLSIDQRQAAQARRDALYEMLGVTEETVTDATSQVQLRSWLKTSDSFQLRLAQAAISRGGYITATDFHNRFVLEGYEARMFGPAFHDAARILMPSWGTTIQTRAAAPRPEERPSPSDVEVTSAREFINSEDMYALTSGFQTEIPDALLDLKAAGGRHTTVTDANRVQFAKDMLNSFRQTLGVEPGTDLGELISSNPSNYDRGMQRQVALYELVVELSELSPDVLEDYFARLFPGR